MSVNATVRPYGARDKIGYALGDFGCNMSFQLVSSYALVYFTQGMGLSLASWGIIVVLAKIFDAINDPIIGSMVDKRKPTANGKFRPWIFYGSFAILITTVLMFVDISAWNYGIKFAYALITYCLWSIAYTSANVPYGALNTVLTEDISERAKLSSFRNIGAGLAVLPVMIILPLIVYAESDTGIEELVASRFVWIAIVMGLIGMLGFMALYFLTRERLPYAESKEKYNLKKSLKDFCKNRPVLGIGLASFAQLGLVMSMQTTMQTVFQVYFMNTSMTALASVLLFAPMIFLIPFVGKLTQKFGKKEISLYPMILSVVVLLAMLFIDFPRTNAGALIYIAMMSVANLGIGLFTLVTWSFVADAVDYQELKSGRREEGTVYSIYSFIRKLAQAFCQGAIVVMYIIIGLDTNNITATTDAVATSTMRISIILPFVGIIIMLLALALVYNLDKDSTIKQSEAIKAKHSALYAGFEAGDTSAESDDSMKVTQEEL
ncbi:MAG: glycoside-pentoside-hexuronide (GPH):cation symporter [Bacillota bacterium]